MQDRIFQILVEKDEITWQSIIYELVRTGQMDPWDIDISLLAKRYLEVLNKLQQANFHVSGKVILAAAILLRMKSERLLTHHIATFDEQLFAPGELEEEFTQADIEELSKKIKLAEKPRLVLKTPFARKRKVTLNDLIAALHRALEVDKRRTLKKLREQTITEKLEVPKKKIDVTQLIKNLYARILEFFKRKERLTFSEIVPSERKEDKILTFIPLLHLVNQGKIDIYQQEHFGEIYIVKDLNNSHQS